MNNPVPKYFDHPDKSVRFLEWESLKRLHFSHLETPECSTNMAMADAYPKHEQLSMHWQDHFFGEIKRKPNNPNHKLYLKVVHGELASLDEVYVELKKVTKPTLRGNALKQAKKKVAQTAYAQEKYREAFVDNRPLVSAVKSAAVGMAFNKVPHEGILTKITELVDVHSADQRLSEEQLNTLVGLCQRRIDKLEALDKIEAAILDSGDNTKALLFLWIKIRRHYEVDETIVMSEQEWAAFGKISKGKVKPLLKALTHKKLGALQQVQKGEQGSKKGKASIYRRLV